MLLAVEGDPGFARLLQLGEQLRPRWDRRRGEPLEARRQQRFHPLADENLGRMARLDEVRAAYDPDGLFHPWMGRLR